MILIIGILAAIALPAFLQQQLKGQDSRAKSNARNMVSQIAACYEEVDGYVGCAARLTPAETGLPVGPGAGNVQITAESPLGYTIVAISKGDSGSGLHTYTISYAQATGTTTTAPHAGRAAARPTATGSRRPPLADIRRMNLKRRPQRAEESSMPRPASALSDERGYTLVELMVAALVLIIGLLGTFQLLDGANKASVCQQRAGWGPRTSPARSSRTRERWTTSSSRPRSSSASSRPAARRRPRRPRRDPARDHVHHRRTGLHVRRPQGQRVLDAARERLHTAGAGGRGRDQPARRDAARRLPQGHAQHQLGQGHGRCGSFVQTSLVNNPSGGLGPRITKFDPAVTGGAQFTSGSSATFPTETTDADVGALGQRRLAERLRRFDGRRTGVDDDVAARDRGDAAVARSGHGAVAAQYAADTVLDGLYLVTAQASRPGRGRIARAQTLALNRSLPLTVQGSSPAYNELL